jgi:hypothetical protein
MARFVQITWCEIALQYILPSTNRWSDREGKSMPGELPKAHGIPSAQEMAPLAYACGVVV